MNMKLVGGLGGALLLAAGIFIIARRRRHSSRRDQALRAARESAKLAASTAAATAESIRESEMGRRVISAMPDRDAVESAMEQNAKRASHVAGHLAKRVRQQIGR